MSVELENHEGQQIPSVKFKTRANGEWQEIHSDDLFKGKKIIAFGLPGAFTPTCSSSHLPRYDQLAKSFKEVGVDDILCLSVNDAFVMEAWQKDQNAKHIKVIPDGNGEFTQQIGMLVDKSDLGFGKRSWRYSMFVDDGVIKKMFIEQDKPGDPFEVSDADTMLKYLAPDKDKPKSVLIFTRLGCPFCAKAKELLNKHGMEYEEVTIGRDVSTNAIMAVSGKTSVPQTFIDGQLVGGSEALEAYFNAA